MSATAHDALAALDRETIQTMGADSIALVSIAASLERIAIASEIIAAMLETWNGVGALEVTMRRDGLGGNVILPRNEKPPTG